MNFEAVLILVVILVTVIFDAMRDAWVYRRAGIGWWQWHIVKWCALYYPFVMLGYFYFEICGCGLTDILIFTGWGIFCWGVWRKVYKFQVS